MTRKIAFFIRNIETSGAAQQKLWRCGPPMVLEYRDGGVEATSEWIISSALRIASYTGCPETCLFLADTEGEITHWTDLPGSLRDVYDHEAALRAAGYEPMYSKNEGAPS